MLDKEQIDNWKEEQLTMFQYWSNDQDGERDPRSMTPLDMVKEYQKASKQNVSLPLYYSLIMEEVEEWTEAKFCGSDEKELKELADIVYVLYGYANANDWDLDEAVRRVHENNMGRMFQPDGTIQRRADGKIIKNKDFPKVDLGDLV